MAQQPKQFAAQDGLEGITVCICTFKRPHLLLRSLRSLVAQRTEGLFTVSIVVVDNDDKRSAERLVRDFARSASVPVHYAVEPERNIALARNRSLAVDPQCLVAFIDDDEFAPENWLLRLFCTLKEFGADGVLGPVLPHFDEPPPTWVTKGKFFERPSHPTGYTLGWEECRTGNALLRQDVIDEIEGPFDRRFATGGEDADLFRRLEGSGKVFRWCSEAPVHEVVPASRCSLTFLLGRALLRGGIFHKRKDGKVKDLLKSVLAVPVYVLVLPVSLPVGRHVFIKYLVKLFEHSARLISVTGVQLVREREM